MNSMTGYGRVIKEINGHKVTIEMKAVNSKYSDINIKMPYIFNFMEEDIKKEILKRISRGKIDMYISYEELENCSNTVNINKELSMQYINEIKEIAENTGINSNIEITKILTLPEVLKIDKKIDEDVLRAEINEVLGEVLDKFIEMRKIEGENIRKDISSRIDRIEDLVNKISSNSAGLIEEYVVKLEKRIENLLSKEVIDKDRLAQEVVIYADKSSVEEEITRLNSHIMQVRELLNKEEPVGKKLDFIIQEMNRETNTIGSKSGSTEITNLVIQTKVEIEDMREQVQNIE